MKITADTNLLVRAVLRDSAEQVAIVERLFSRATLVVVPLPVVCELAWVLRGVGVRGVEMAHAISQIVDAEIIRTDRDAVDAGLASLRAGGDFADGAIAAAGAAMGGPLFVSFDAHAVGLRRGGGGRAATPEDALTA